MESEKGNNSGDSRMTQALGTEPLLIFSRDKDIAAQFIQLLRALQQQERRQDWPMLCSLTIQMEHCDYCLRDYCSLINYKRHIELHKRDSEEESAKNKILLAQFWEKISSEEAKEVVSFKDIVLKEVSGSSVIKELTSIVRRAGFSYLPEPYLKSGSQILDIIEGGRFPISSKQLFTVLDCTSEKTFLCGPTSSLQKYIMDGDNTERMVLESRNVIAYMGIQLEQKLIGAWLADREAESERFRKLLEEEEIALRRRAEDLEKKKQKKLRKREQKEDEQGAALKEDNEMASEETSSAVEHTDPDVVVSDEQIALASGDIDSGYGSNGDESPFLPVIGRKWRQRVLRSSETVEPTSSHEAQDSQASALAFDSQSPKLTINSSQEAQDSQASNLDLTSKPPKIATFPSSSRPAQDSEAPKFAGFPAYSNALQGRRGPNLSNAPTRPHVPQQNFRTPELPNLWTCSHPLAPSSANGPRASNARSHVPQFRSAAARRYRQPRHRRNRGAHRTASSTSHNVLTSNGEPELGGGFSEARAQKDSTIPSPTSEGVNWANMVEEEARKEPEAPAKEQETTNEEDPTQEHQVMIGSLSVSVNPEFGSLPVTFGTFNLKEHDNSEARGTIPMAEGQTPENGSSHDEPKESDPVQTGPTAVLWTETLIPNGSRDLDAGFVNMKGNLFENMDWEAAIHIAEAFLQQRWKKAIVGEHVTVSLVPASENATKASQLRDLQL